MSRPRPPAPHWPRPRIPPSCPPTRPRPTAGTTSTSPARPPCGWPARTPTTGWCSPAAPAARSTPRPRPPTRPPGHPATRPALTVTYLPPAAPGAPTGVKTIAGDSAALVSWAEPGNPGIAAADDPVTGYTVQILDPGGTVVAARQTTDTTAVLPGLTNGVA